jgi:hypothetical protein
LTDRPFIQIPQYYGRPKEAGELWRLTKGRRTAFCNLWTHPIGGEVRAGVDGELMRSEAGRDGTKLIDLALEWKRGFVEKGWA